MSMKEEYTAIDMATAAADGFRAGQRAAQSAPAGEREAFELASVDDSFGSLRALGAEAERRGLENGDYIDLAARKAWEYFQAGAAWQRAQGAVPDALREAVEYLDDNPFNEIGAGSILHRAMRDALAAAPSPSKQGGE